MNDQNYIIQFLSSFIQNNSGVFIGQELLMKSSYQFGSCPNIGGKTCSSEFLGIFGKLTSACFSQIRFRLNLEVLFKISARQMDDSPS